MALTADVAIIGGGVTATGIAFRYSRFAEGKPIRGICGDWLMC